IPAELGPREYFNDLGVKLWCRMLGVLDKCRKYSFGVDLGARIRPAMALDGRFTGSSFVRKLLQTKAHVASRPSPLASGYRLGKGFRRSVTSKPETSCSASEFRYYYPWNTGQNFRSRGRRPIPLPPALVRHNHLHPCRNGAGPVERLIGRLAPATETQTSRSTLSRTRYWIA